MQMFSICSTVSTDVECVFTRDRSVISVKKNYLGPVCPDPTNNLPSWLRVSTTNLYWMLLSTGEKGIALQYIVVLCAPPWCRPLSYEEFSKASGSKAHIPSQCYVCLLIHSVFLHMVLHSMCILKGNFRAPARNLNFKHVASLLY